MLDKASPILVALTCEPLKSEDELQSSQLNLAYIIYDRSSDKVYPSIIMELGQCCVHNAMRVSVLFSRDCIFNAANFYIRRGVSYGVANTSPYNVVSMLKLLL